MPQAKTEDKAESKAQSRKADESESESSGTPLPGTAPVVLPDLDEVTARGVRPRRAMARNPTLDYPEAEGKNK